MGTWDTGILCNDSALDLMYDIENLNVETELVPFIDNYIKHMGDRYISCADVFLIIELIDMSLNGVDFEILVNRADTFSVGAKDLYGYGELFNSIAKHPMPQFLDWAINTFTENRKYEEGNIDWVADAIESRKHILDKIWNRLKSYEDTNREVNG
jgi:hypothetical protein